MKKEPILLVFVLLATVAIVLADTLYVSGLRKKFMQLERQRIITSNKLATARIVHENLNHVRDMVLENMDFPGQKDTITHETHLFEFITTCVNDLKLKLVSVKPKRPETSGRITTYTYNIEVEGDFFSFGELCAKFENSRRIIALQSYSVSLLDKGETLAGAPEHKKIAIKMHLDTYRIKKSPDTDTTTGAPGAG
jgi:Tfp pilus assembly protein PilO